VFVLLLAIDLILAVVLGVVTAKIIEFVLGTRLQRGFKIAYVLVTGLLIFQIAFWIDSLKIGIHVEPLLQAMIVGFFITNFTRFRDEFEEILHDVGPAVYVAFFTLTGVALKLDILITTIGIALVLFGVRVVGISLGAFAGSALVGDDPRFRRFLGLGLVTQAGIALGLAREVAIEFPGLGDEFATMVIAVVVLNEIFGPIMLKYVLNRIGEARTPEAHEPDAVRDALILGIEGQSTALARQLQSNGWHVTLADTDPSRVNGEHGRVLPAISYDGLKKVMTSGTDALVAMLDDDDANYAACELAYERFGVQRLIVRPNDMTHTERFTALGAVIVDPATAIVNVIDQAVRTPQSAALFMHRDPEFDIVQITITETDCDGVLLRDLRLPDDVLVLEISRNGHSIVPNGSTMLACNDDVTFVGKPPSLREVTRRFGY
jgi:Trk K+ transport system NAD-binding subunit